MESGSITTDTRDFVLRGWSLQFYKVIGYEEGGGEKLHLERLKNHEWPTGHFESNPPTDVLKQSHLMK